MIVDQAQRFHESIEAFNDSAIHETNHINRLCICATRGDREALSSRSAEEFTRYQSMGLINPMFCFFSSLLSTSRSWLFRSSVLALHPVAGGEAPIRDSSYAGIPDGPSTNDVSLSAHAYLFRRTAQCGGLRRSPNDRTHKRSPISKSKQTQLYLRP